MPSSPGSSEAETLIPPSPPEDTNLTGSQDKIDEPDVPIHFSEFVFECKIIKGLLALLLPACLATEAAHLLLWLRTNQDVTYNTVAGQRVQLGLTVTDAFGIGLVVSHSSLYVPVSCPDSWRYRASMS